MTSVLDSLPKKKRSLRPRSDVASKKAAPFRELLKSLLHKKVSSKSDKLKLAQFLDQSVSYVDKMLYEAEGGLDSWVCAMMYAYGLEPVHFEKFAAGQLFGDPEAVKNLGSPKMIELHALINHLSSDELDHWHKVIKETRETGAPRLL